MKKKWDPKSFQKPIGLKLPKPFPSKNGLNRNQEMV